MPVYHIHTAIHAIIIVCFLCIATKADAQLRTEKELVDEIIISLQTDDDSSYASLFPVYDSLKEYVIAYSVTDSYKNVRLNTLKTNIHYLRHFDALYNPDILSTFHFSRQKAIDSNIHWSDILIARYELDKQRLPRELIGFEQIAPLRLQGIIFVKDMLTRRIFGIAVKNILMIDGEWYGGQVVNILEASNKTEYNERLRLEMKEMQALLDAKEDGTLDSILAVKRKIREEKNKAIIEKDEDSENTAPLFKEVVDKKLFRGFYDKEIYLELYVRYLKGSCPDPVCGWEAMYRFEDYDDFVPLEVKRKEDGTYMFTEEDMGVMEVKRKGDLLVGKWVAFSDKTEYDIVLKEEKDLKDRRVKKLDKQLEDFLFY